MIEYIKGDAVKALQNGDINVLLHVVNCQGVMGSGIAKQIKEEYPEVYKLYRRNYEESNVFLGQVLGVDVGEGKCVVNLHAQGRYGFDKRHLNYGALSITLNKTADHYTYSSPIIGLPCKMGCDRAGGDWEVVLEMVQYYFKNFRVKVYSLV